MNKQTQNNLLELVKNSYNDIADEFSQTREKALWPELVKLASLVKTGQSVLDIGCGNGRLVEAFADRNIRYLGVDNNKRLVELARSKFSIFNFSRFARSGEARQFSNNFQFSNFQFQIADILELEKVIKEKFDWVFGVAVLHHLPGNDLRLSALKQIKNRLKENGKIILTVWNLWSQKKFRRLILKTWCEKIIRKLGLMSRRYSRDPDFALRTSGDWGDILFDWKDSRGKSLSQRYYHAFTMKGLKKIIKGAKLKIEKLYKDEYNYYAILTKN